MPPAARVGDMHTCPMVNPGPVPHVGGPILPPGCPTVLIGMMPAARVGDMCTCAGPPDVIAKGSPTVLIGGMMAARLGDLTVHGGVITVGCPTVMIGEVGMGGGGAPSAPGAPAAAPGASGSAAPATPGAGGGGAATGPKKFPTAEAAAIDAMKSVNAKSVKEGREYGGWVYKNDDGTYSYDPPVKGTKDGLSNMPDKRDKDVAWYHTHGAPDPGYDNENFSGDDGDKGYSKANKAVGYVATPSGAIKKYDPATDTVTTLGDTAPP